MTIVGCYDLNLYCDTCRPTGGGSPQAEFYEFDRATAFRSARAAGWIISHKKHTAKCPECSGRVPRGDKA